MQSDITKACADFLRVKFSDDNAKLKASHAHEIVAAFFGYGSRAALLSDRAYDLENLPDAALLIPDVRTLSKRLTELQDLPSNLPTSRDISSVLLFFLQENEYFNGDVSDAESIADFVLEEFLPNNTDEIDDELGGVMANTNAYFDELYFEKADVKHESDAILITVTGQYSGETHPDKMFSGDQIDVTVVVKLPRYAGKTAFSQPELTVGGVVQDSRDPDDFIPPPFLGERNKEHILRVTGGFRVGESQEEFQARQQKILSLRQKIQSGGGGEDDVNELSRLLGNDRDDEFDYDLDKD